MYDRGGGSRLGPAPRTTFRYIRLSPRLELIELGRLPARHPAVALTVDSERIEVRLRPPARARELETRREIAARLRQEHIAELTRKVSGQRLHAEILRRFSASLGKVVPADEPAPIPAIRPGRR